LPLIEAIFLIIFFVTGLITRKRISANGFATKAELVATTAIDAVVVMTPAGGIAFNI
tara:strand:- start:49 stop:219 length:171 start_codon:yes stop_codon:yes gene_type:complete